MLAEVVVSQRPTERSACRRSASQLAAERGHIEHELLFAEAGPLSKAACPPQMWLEACRAPTGPPPGWSNSSSRKTACRVPCRTARSTSRSRQPAARPMAWGQLTTHVRGERSGSAAPRGASSHSRTPLEHESDHHRGGPTHFRRKIIGSGHSRTTNARRALVRRRRRCLELKSHHHHGGPTHSRERHTFLQENDCIARSPSEPPRIRMIT